MRVVSLFLGAFVALAAGVLAQSDQVPPPACLQACMDKTGNCRLCTDAGNKEVSNCINTTCGFRDVTYANAYYGSVCSNKGYQNYQTNPPHFQKVPDDSCKASTTSCSTAKATPKPSKRAALFEA